MSRRSTRHSSNPLARFRRRYVAERHTAHAAYVSRDLRIVFHSPAWRDWLGDAPVDGRNVRDVLGPEACQAFRRCFDSALAGRQARVAARLKSPPLGPRTVELSCIPQISETGETRGFIALAVEIPTLSCFGETELERYKREGEALGETQDRLRRAVEWAEVGTWDWDLRTGTCSWNTRLGSLWGLRPAAQGDRGIFLANVHPEDRDRVEEVLRAAMSPGHPGAVGVEFRTVSPLDGSERWISSHITVLRDETGNPTRLIGTALDVTARKVAKAELQYRKTLLEAQSEAALDGILVVNDAGRMVSFNRRFVEMWRIPPEIAESRSDEAALESVLRSLVSPEDFMTQVRYLYAHREEKSRDELLLKDGRHFDRYSAPVRSEEGVHYGRIWFFRDVTEEKNRETALREGADRLKEALVELNTLAYSVAHDLRAPLRAIAGFGDLLQEDYARAIAPGAGEHIARIKENTRRMDRLIMDLLSYSRLTREPMPQEKVVLGPLVSEILARMGPEFRECGASVDVIGPSPAVLAHRPSLDLVIFNLISNAVKFMAPGTRPRVRIVTEERPGRIRLWVEDNGIGIAPEHQDRIFGVFQQLHSPAEHSGTGIGLAIVKRAVERMGGSVGVESGAGKGSRFWIELPAPKPDVPAGEPSE